MKLEVSIGVLKRNAPAVRRWRNKGKILGRDIEWSEPEGIEVNPGGMIVLPPSPWPRFIKIVEEEAGEAPPAIIRPGQEDA